MPKASVPKIATLLESILDGVVKIKKMDGPLSATSKRRLKHAKALLKAYKKGEK